MLKYKYINTIQGALYYFILQLNLMFKDPFVVNFEPYILAVISESIANYPQNEIRFNAFYPPQPMSNSVRILF